jgi:hypothetical protein
MSVRMMEDVIAMHDISTHCPLCGKPTSEGSHTDEHIFPGWLQRQYHLANLHLEIPNFLNKQYRTVRIGICARCNNETFSALETAIAPALTAQDTFYATRSEVFDSTDIAIWLGKILWLLVRKGHSVEDHNTRNLEKLERIVPEDLLPGLAFLGVLMQCRATDSDMYACFLTDPPIPEFFYSIPYSLYRRGAENRGVPLPAPKATWRARRSRPTNDC